MTELSSPTSAPISSTRPSHSDVPALSTAGRVIAPAAMRLATARPSNPAQRRPVLALSRMYAAHAAPASRAYATPTRSSPVRWKPRRATPTAASSSHTIAVGEISPNRPLAIAAPSCTERIPTITRPTGPSTVGLGRWVTGQAYSARWVALEAVQRTAGVATLGGEVVESPVGDQRGKAERLSRTVRSPQRLTYLGEVGRGSLELVEVVHQHAPGLPGLAGVADEQPQQHGVLRTGNPGRRLVHPVPQRLLARLGDGVRRHLAAVVRSRVRPHQPEPGEASQLGVDLAHRGRDPVEAERDVGALLDLVPRQLVAEGEEAEDRVPRHRNVLTHRPPRVVFLIGIVTISPSRRPRCRAPCSWSEPARACGSGPRTSPAPRGTGPGRTSRWRRSTPSWSTPAAARRGCSRA